MNNKIEKEIINVEMKTFKDLSRIKLTIPNFQRSYVWKNENLQKILNDFEEFISSKKDEYYMGTILLYKNNDTYEIIDGQQRITTLTILYSVVYGKSIPNNFQLSFSSQESINNIIESKNYFSKKIENERLCNDLRNIFEKLTFTVIITTSEDEAFTFFDTQNSRGVKLKAIDLLKAHHLRAINDNDKQRISAKKWENIETHKEGFLRKKSDFIDELFKYILFRSRVWRGNQKEIITIENSERIQNEKIKEEFEKGSNTTKIKLYPHPKNMLVHSIDIDENEEYIMDFRWKQYRQKPKDLPFSLRQPISKGLEFFLYVEKYAQIVQYLTSTSKEIYSYKVFFNKIIEDNSFSIYLREFFMLCSVCYYDKFEHYKLYEFSLWLEYVLGAIRIEQSMIVEKTVPKIVRELPYNIIDIIIGAYSSDEAIDYLQSIRKIGNNEITQIYRFKNISGKIDEESIRDRYLKNIKSFFNQEDAIDLSKKHDWISERINNVKSI